MGHRRAQPAADHRRSHRHRRAGARRNARRIDGDPARLEQRARGAAPRRRPPASAAPSGCQPGPPARQRTGRAVRDGDGRGPISHRPCRRVPLRPQRQERPGDGDQRTADLRRSQPGADDRPGAARRVPARCPRPCAVRDHRAEARCLRRLERRARSRRARRVGVATLCVSRDDRRRRPRPPRPLGPGSGIRRGVDSTRGRTRMGAVHHRPLDLGGALGLDLGRRGALGFCPVPLRSLGAATQCLVLGAGQLRGPSRLCPGAGRLGRRPATGAPARRQHRHLDRPRLRGLVPALAARALRARLPFEPALRARTESIASPAFRFASRSRRSPGPGGSR